MIELGLIFVAGVAAIMLTQYALERYLGKE